MMLATQISTVLTLPFNFGAIEQTLVSNEAVGRLLLACVLGGVVGIERELQRRAAGVRTNLLICMACAFFTLLSAVLAGDNSPNRGQVAANIVQGIGFLGAGLIIHNRSRVSGFASAASVFVVASIGMACGAGLYGPAIIATLIVFLSLFVVGGLERSINLKIYPQLYEARGNDATGMLLSILDAMDKEKERLGTVDRSTIGTLERISFTLTATKKRHERLFARLAAEPSINALKIFQDPEED
jgi:putative Mg2+ transporter-C (MgtC) family protein